MYTQKELLQVNAKLRQKDESHLWPINGKFNVTERAIRRVQKAIRQGLTIDDIESYEAILEQEITNVVNDAE